MNHQHSDTMESKMHDMKAQMKENTNCEQRCMQILRDATGFSLSDVRKKFNNPSDQYFTAKQLIDLKIADNKLYNFKVNKTNNKTICAGEIKSVSDKNFSIPKNFSVKLIRKYNS